MSKLPDDLIGQYWRQANQRDDSWMPFIHVRFARAIEAAATEPLLHRIAELERKSDQDDETILWQAKEISEKIDKLAELERLRSEDHAHAIDMAVEIERLKRQLEEARTGNS